MATSREADSKLATSEEADFGESARDSSFIPKYDTGYGHDVAVSPLLTKGWHGYSEPYRWKISGKARHCCHACPDLSHSAQYTVPTTPA